MEGFEQLGAYALFGAAWLSAAGWIVLSMSAARRGTRHVPEWETNSPPGDGRSAPIPVPTAAPTQSGATLSDASTTLFRRSPFASES